VPGDSAAGILLLLGIVVIVILAWRFWYLPRKGDGALPWVKKS
jgi:hypothetical protein